MKTLIDDNISNTKELFGEKLSFIKQVTFDLNSQTFLIKTINGETFQSKINDDNQTFHVFGFGEFGRKNFVSFLQNRVH